MKYAIIAGGEGSRLAQEGVKDVKPLVAINGERLIDRLVRVFTDNGAESIVIVYRDSMQGVARHLETLQHDGIGGKHVDIDAVEAHTPSSMHSLFAMSGQLKDAPFCLTTVDTVFSEAAFRGYIDAFTAAVSCGTAMLSPAATSSTTLSTPVTLSVNLTSVFQIAYSVWLVSGALMVSPALYVTSSGVTPHPTRTPAIDVSMPISSGPGSVMEVPGSTVTERL